MKSKYSHSVLVFIKKKYAYSKREEQIQVLAYGLGGKYIGGGTNLSNGKRDQQFYFKSLENVKTFLNYPTVKEAILTEVDTIPITE